MGRTFTRHVSIVGLSDGVSRGQHGLDDHVRDHTFALNPTGLDTIDLLCAGHTVADTARVLAERYDQDVAVTLRDTMDLVSALDEQTLVRVTTPWTPPRPRRPRGPLLPTLQNGLLALAAFDLPSAPAVRRAASVRAIVAAVVPALALGVLVVASAVAVVVAAIIAAGVHDLLRPALGNALAFPLWVLALVVVTIAIHELGHYGVLRTRLRPDRLVVVRRGISVSVAHPVLPHRADAVAVAVAGPFAATALAGVLAAGAAVALPGPFWVAAIAVGLSHLYSLAPWHPDGKMLFGRRSTVSTPVSTAVSTT